MTVQSSPLAHAYHQRLGSFVSDERFGDPRLKLYGLAAPEQGVRPELLERTRAFAAAGADLDSMEPVGPTALGCVWEPGIIEFERRAWIADVIGNPGGPDLDRYLSRRFEGLI